MATATMTVDGTKDRDNIWWALIKRNVASSLDLDASEAARA